VFKAFTIKSISLKYTVSKGKQTTGKEFLVKTIMWDDYYLTMLKKLWSSCVIFVGNIKSEFDRCIN